MSDFYGKIWSENQLDGKPTKSRALLEMDDMPIENNSNWIFAHWYAMKMQVHLSDEKPSFGHKKCFDWL